MREREWAKNHRNEKEKIANEIIVHKKKFDLHKTIDEFDRCTNDTQPNELKKFSDFKQKYFGIKFKKKISERKLICTNWHTKEMYYFFKLKSFYIIK